MNHAKIKSALAALMCRDNEDAFLILMEKHTGKFLQFSGSARQPLILDLPAQALDHDQAQKAESYFQELGIRAVEYEMFDAPGGKVVGRQRSFQKSLGRDVEAAARIAENVFEYVYEFPANFELVMEEN